MGKPQSETVQAEKAAHGPGTAGKSPRLGRFLRALNVDVIFLLLLTAIFVFQWIGSLEFRAPAHQMPRYVATAGLILVAIHAAQQFFAKRRGKRDRGRILDIGYEQYTLDITPALVWKRTAGFFGLMALVSVGGAVFSFHVALPLFVLGYLLVLGRAQWWLAIAAAVGVEVLILVVYGVFANAIWPTSLIEAWLDIRMQEILEVPIRALL